MAVRLLPFSCRMPCQDREAARQGATLSGADVTILDSSFTDQAEKFQVVEAARMAQAGASKEEILAAIETVKEKRNYTSVYQP